MFGFNVLPLMVVYHEMHPIAPLLFGVKVRSEVSNFIVSFPVYERVKSDEAKLSITISDV